MILVTGATGLVGSHLLLHLVQDHAKVRALYRSEGRKEQVLKLFRFHFGSNCETYFQKIDWIPGDILDVLSLEEACSQVEVVYHCAALVSFRRRDFYRLQKVNRQGTANVVNAALSCKVKVFAHVSSTAAIGGTGPHIRTEEDTWKRESSTSGYSISKYGAEKEVWRGAEEGLKVVMVNPSVILGAGSWKESSLTILRTVQKGLVFYTSGANAVVDVRDVVDVLIQGVEKECFNQRFLCIGENLSFKDLTTRIALQLKKKPPYIGTKPWVLNLALLIVNPFFWIFGKNSPLTWETIRSSFNKVAYSNQKASSQFEMKFKSADQAIEYAIAGRLD